MVGGLVGSCVGTTAELPKLGKGGLALGSMGTAAATTSRGMAGGMASWSWQVKVQLFKNLVNNRGGHEEGYCE